jgi:hypothetical protein
MDRLSFLCMELLEHLDVQNGLPMVTVYAEGRYRECPIADERVIRTILKIKECLNEQETTRER